MKKQQIVCYIVGGIFFLILAELIPQPKGSTQVVLLLIAGVQNFIFAAIKGHEQ